VKHRTRIYLFAGNKHKPILKGRTLQQKRFTTLFPDRAAADFGKSIFRLTAAAAIDLRLLGTLSGLNALDPFREVPKSRSSMWSFISWRVNNRNFFFPSLLTDGAE
jgi:hypothetical protein